ncbi:lipopolysaccharide biosynthesis protein [Priestia megaterium]|uniref:lipopolysaccharide biosynthesis protein n=1 Tax=Priestia megaterium TaxID=1404 RepID=UPI00203DE1B3|nr:hypothetical protein [Priestia megaterium]MCM3544956.1 hypothetical protein [Priestia megaterium]
MSKLSFNILNGFEKGNYFSRILRGISANMLNQLINILNKLALVPFFISNWGTRTYGEWLVVTSVVSYLALTDMGGTNYIINKLTQSFSMNREKEFRRVLKTGVTIFLILSTLITLMAIIAVKFLSLNSLLSLKYTNSYTINIVIVVLAFQVSLSLLLGLIIGTYRSIGYYAKSVMFSNLIQFLQLISVFLVLVLKKGMVAVALGQLSPLILVGVYVVWNLNRDIPKLNIFSFDEINFKEGISFFVPSFNFFMIQMSQLLVTQGTVIVVGKMLGPTAVVIYTLARTVINIVRQVLGMVMNSSKPEITRLDIQEKDSELANLFKQITQITLVCGCIVGLILHFYGETLYGLWLNNTVAFNQHLIDSLLFYILLMTFWFGFADFLMAVNRHKHLSVVILISSTLNVIFATLGANIVGLNGVVLGLIVGDLVLACWFIPYLALKYKPIMNLKTIIKQISLLLIFLLNIVFNNIFMGIITLIILMYIFIINITTNNKVTARFR